MSRTIRFGDRGDDVRALQDVLNFHIRRLERLTVDGIYGAITLARVKEFQKINGLVQDGLVGKKTNEKLFSIEKLNVSIGVFPRLTLPRPSLTKKFAPPGMLPPLIPPLMLRPIPQKPSPLAGLKPKPKQPALSFVLAPNGIASVPRLQSPGQVFQLTLTSPVRADPVDPRVASYNQLMVLLRGSNPAPGPFQTFILGLVPKPKLEVLDIGDMQYGFNWGRAPLFDVASLSPLKYSYGLNVNAKYTLKIVDHPGPAGFKMGVYAMGDAKGEFNFNLGTVKALEYFHLSGAVNFGLGIEGRF